MDDNYIEFLDKLSQDIIKNEDEMVIDIKKEEDIFKYYNNLFNKIINFKNIFILKNINISQKYLNNFNNILLNNELSNKLYKKNKYISLTIFEIILKYIINNDNIKINILKNNKFYKIFINILNKNKGYINYNNIIKKIKKNKKCPNNHILWDDYSGICDGECAKYYKKGLYSCEEGCEYYICNDCNYIYDCIDINNNDKLLYILNNNNFIFCNNIEINNAINDVKNNYIIYKNIYIKKKMELF